MCVCVFLSPLTDVYSCHLRPEGEPLCRIGQNLRNCARGTSHVDVEAGPCEYLAVSYVTAPKIFFWRHSRGSFRLSVISSTSNNSVCHGKGAFLSRRGYGESGRFTPAVDVGAWPFLGRFSGFPCNSASPNPWSCLLRACRTNSINYPHRIVTGQTMTLSYCVTCSVFTCM